MKIKDLGPAVERSIADIGSWFIDGLRLLINVDFANMTIGQGLFTLGFIWVVFICIADDNQARAAQKRAAKRRPIGRRIL